MTNDTPTKKIVIAEIYRHRVDYWQWFDNSARTPQLLEEGTNQ